MTEDKYPNWFKITAEPSFNKYLMKYAGKGWLTFLQIGVFTGDASVWLAENVLTGDDCILVDLDTWGGSEGEAVHKEFDWADVEATYDAKTSKYTCIDKIKGDSKEFFAAKDMFDFIYIDADHTAKGTYDDAQRCWGSLKKSGILAFDDYTWTHESGDPEQTPKPGIDKFLEEHKDELTVLEIGAQVWVEKK